MHHDKDVFNLPTAQSVKESIYALAANQFSNINAKTINNVHYSFD